MLLHQNHTHHIAPIGPLHVALNDWKHFSIEYLWGFSSSLQLSNKCLYTLHTASCVYRHYVVVFVLYLRPLCFLFSVLLYFFYDNDIVLGTTEWIGWHDEHDCNLKQLHALMRFRNHRVTGHFSIETYWWLGLMHSKHPAMFVVAAETSEFLKYTAKIMSILSVTKIVRICQNHKSITAHVNKIPTSCFRLNVFRLKKLNKQNFKDIGLCLTWFQSRKHVNGKSRMITIIEISQKHDVGI